jgi:hypothetical protein
MQETVTPLDTTTSVHLSIHDSHWLQKLNCLHRRITVPAQTFSRYGELVSTASNSASPPLSHPVEGKQPSSHTHIYMALQNHSKVLPLNTAAASGLNSALWSASASANAFMTNKTLVPLDMKPVGLSFYLI